MTRARIVTAPVGGGATRPSVRVDDAAAPPASSQVLRALGGFRGVLDGGLPPLVFVVAHAVAGRGHGLGTAIGAAGAAALVVVGVRLFRRETLRPVLGGLIGLAVAVTFAALSGDARAFFLPGIYVDAAYAVGFLVSAVVGRPLVGSVYGMLFGQRRSWRADRRLRRLFAVATVGWSLVFALRAGVQGALYAADEPGLLAAAKLVLGWPLTAVAAALTLAAVSRAVGMRNGGDRGAPSRAFRGLGWGVPHRRAGRSLVLRFLGLLLVVWLVLTVVGAIVEGLFWLAVVGLLFFVATAVFGLKKRDDPRLTSGR